MSLLKMQRWGSPCWWMRVLWIMTTTPMNAEACEQKACTYFHVWWLKKTQTSVAYFNHCFLHHSPPFFFLSHSFSHTNAIMPSTTANVYYFWFCLFLVVLQIWLASSAPEGWMPATALPHVLGSDIPLSPPITELSICQASLSLPALCMDTPGDVSLFWCTFISFLWKTTLL